MNKIPEHKHSHALGIGVGIAALAAAAAGAYYLYGSDKSAKNRKHVKSWMLKMKAEVMDHVENMKDLSQNAYNKIIDEVSDKYSKIKDIDTDELKSLAERMKSHWKEIQADISETVGPEIEKVIK
ncbi:MAG: hypothetical protein PHG25_01975 [Candidatus Pacebacteria bacterium]|nr:hypothetical protein [Candidatus Paceibacterota bacterium]